MPACNFCAKVFTSWDNVQLHKSLNPECRRKANENLTRVLENLREKRRAKDRAKAARRAARSGSPVHADEPPNIMPVVDDELLAAPAEFDAAENAPGESEPNAVPPPSATPVPGPAILGSAPKTASGHDMPWRKTCLGHAGATYGPAKTVFEEIRDEEILKGAEVLGPFRDEQEWELAKWLIKHVGHRAADEFLKLSIVSLYGSEFCRRSHQRSRSPTEQSHRTRGKMNSSTKLTVFRVASNGNVKRWM